MKSSLHFGVLPHIATFLFLLAGNTLQLAAQASQEEENLNIYTGVSSAILPKDGTEINLLSSINSFWIAVSAFDGSIDASRIANRLRYSRVDHILRVSHGFSRSGRWDLGMDIYYTRVRFDDEARSSPFRVYGNAYPESGTTHGGVSYIGIQTRIMPFADLPGLTLRAGMGYPIAKTEEQRHNLNAQRTFVSLSALFSERLGPNLLGQVQGDFRSYFRSSENERSLLLPSVSGYLIFEMPGEQWFLVSGLSYNFTLQQSFKGAKFLKANQQLYGSLGVLYRPARILSLILSGQLPFIFDSGSSQSTWVRESYFGVNLGVRCIF